jgi:hypothetical protein
VVSIYMGLLFIEGKKGHFGTVIIKVAYQLGLAKKMNLVVYIITLLAQ